MQVGDLLRAAGHEVTELASPIGATAKILEKEIRVVVIDVNMPTIRGDKLAMMLRRNPRLSHLGVVLISGLDLDELQNVARAVEANGVVTKEQMRDTLVPTVAQAAVSVDREVPKRRLA